MIPLKLSSPQLVLPTRSLERSCHAAELQSLMNSLPSLRLTRNARSTELLELSAPTSITTVDAVEELNSRPKRKSERDFLIKLRSSFRKRRVSALAAFGIVRSQAGVTEI